MQVQLRVGETFENMLRRFTRGVQRSGVISECRRRQEFVSNGEQRRIDEREASKRRRQREKRASMLAARS